MPTMNLKWRHNCKVMIRISCSISPPSLIDFFLLILAVPHSFSDLLNDMFFCCEFLLDNMCECVHVCVPGLCGEACACVRACVCVREEKRERERGGGHASKSGERNMLLLLLLSDFWIWVSVSELPCLEFFLGSVTCNAARHSRCRQCCQCCQRHLTFKPTCYQHTAPKPLPPSSRPSTL